MREIIKTPYPCLIKFLNPDLRLEKSMPVRDNFLLESNISYNQKDRLVMFNNYIVVSNNYYEHEWDRDELVDKAKTYIKSRRKPEYTNLSDEEFEHYMKVFITTGFWPKEQEGEKIFELFKTVGTRQSIPVLFRLLETTPPRLIFFSLLTFASKVLSDSTDEKAGYLRIIQSKRTVLNKTFKKSLEAYTRYTEDMDDQIKLLRFIYDLGQRTH